MENNTARLWYLIGGCLILATLIRIIISEKVLLLVLIDSFFRAKYRIQ
ncbi:hypothetical protein [Enterococcus sp. MMGLQ5-1]|nr:hypothetical protein [Enterococcus sp. MMGLQ5-1]